MIIIGCDFHTRQQQIALLDKQTGEMVERQLQHENGEARRFYEQLGQPVLVAIEATGYTRWFEQMARRRKELLEMLDQWEKPIAELDRAVKQEAENRADAARLMTHPGVGPLTSLAFVLTVGTVDRFARGRQVSGYLGLDPRTDRSADRMRGGPISKQGSSTTRWLLVEAGQTAARLDPELRRVYQRLKLRRGNQIAKVAIARRLAVRLYWMLRSQSDYEELTARLVRMRSSTGSGQMEKSPSRR